MGVSTAVSISDTAGRSLPPYLRIPTSPLAHPENVLSGNRWRISVLDAGLIRLEWSPSGTFADRASQTVLHRDTPVVDKTVRESDAVIEVITDRLHLVYDRKLFSPQGLSVQARGAISNYHSVWRYGERAEGNLGGTARTLDRVDGACQLQDGILSTVGIAVVDDSATVLLDDDGWFTPREPGSLDVYVFCFGRDYRAALRTLYAVTGKQPFLPRFALGNWWSRYHRYTSQEYLALMDRFAAERLPFTVAVLDMDWHPVDIDRRYGSGWTGYSWNRELIPDPARFMAELHRRGLRVTLNVHPADGIRANEDCYPAVASAMGQDPKSGLPVVFDPTDPDFLTAYFEQVHHPLERQGVDFWWLDWQSGRVSRIAGLDPLWLLNHLHFLDAGRPGAPLGDRPMTFSRYAGVGSHRYPIGFSGDTVVSWKSLAFQPEFTATASNVGYGWWSHDIGGHMFGGKDDELATRWLQLGVFSPVLRLHSTSDPFNTKEPWRFGEVARRVMSEGLRLRHRLLPYLATMVHRAHHNDLPLVEPMYYEYPERGEAYQVPNQFRFGSSLLVVPITTPLIRTLGMATASGWLPAGDWVDLMSGLSYRGGRMVPLYRPMDQIPVFAPAGAVIPVLPPDSADNDNHVAGNDSGVPAAIELWVVAGADGEFTLLEDADDDAWASTRIEYRSADGLTIEAVRGAGGTVPDRRSWRVLLLGFARVDGAQVDGRRVAAVPGPVRGSRLVELGEHPTDTRLTIRLLGVDRPGNADDSRGGDGGEDRNDVAGRVFDLLDAAQLDFASKSTVFEAVRDGHSPADTALALHGMRLDPDLLAAVSEILLARP